MENDSKMRDVIQRIVTQEIDKIASETKDVVREVVRASLLPQLRTAIRDFISEAMEEVLSEAKNLPPAQEPGISEEVSSIAPSEPKLRAEGVAISEESVLKEVQVTADGDGRYVYCIADSGVAVSLGQIGIEGSKVYTIPYKGLCAVVHDCPPEPYKSEDEEVVKSWVQMHQKVLDASMEKFGSVLPLGFDTIIKSEDKADPKQVVKDWLKADFENLKEKIDKVRGKDEFGVQIFYDPKIIGGIIAQESEEIGKLKEEMATQKPGMAYMYKQKLEKVVKEEMEKRAQQYFKDYYEAIKGHVDDIKVEKAKKDKDKTMLMNLSCLVLKEKVEDLGNELERIDDTYGFSARFTGPWAPYSFV
jgi:hypothetical protein